LNAVAKRRKKRGFPNNPKKRPMEKKIPFNSSVRRCVVLEFENVCDDLGIGKSPMTEELLLEFIKKIRGNEPNFGRVQDNIKRK